MFALVGAFRHEAAIYDEHAAKLLDDAAFARQRCQHNAAGNPRTASWAQRRLSQSLINDCIDMI